MNSHFVAKCYKYRPLGSNQKSPRFADKKNPASRVLSEPAILPAVARAIATNFPLRSRIFTGARLPNLARIS